MSRNNSLADHSLQRLRLSQAWAHCTKRITRNGENKSSNLLVRRWVIQARCRSTSRQNPNKRILLACPIHYAGSNCSAASRWFEFGKKDEKKVLEIARLTPWDGSMYGIPTRGNYSTPNYSRNFHTRLTRLSSAEMPLFSQLLIYCS